jgi:hypothetical protein
MNRDAVVVDTLHELAARDEEQAVITAMAMCAVMQQQQILLAAMCARDVKGATEQKVNPSETVVRRRA